MWKLHYFKTILYSDRILIYCINTLSATMSAQIRIFDVKLFLLSYLLFFSTKYKFIFYFSLIPFPLGNICEFFFQNNFVVVLLWVWLSLNRGLCKMLDQGYCTQHCGFKGNFWISFKFHCGVLKKVSANNLDIHSLKWEKGYFIMLTLCDNIVNSMPLLSCVYTVVSVPISNPLNPVKHLQAICLVASLYKYNTKCTHTTFTCTGTGFSQTWFIVWREKTE